MNNMIAKFINGQTVKIFAAVIGAVIIVAGILTLTHKTEEIVLDRPASSVRSGNLVSVEKETAGRDMNYYIVTLATEQGHLRCVIEPGYAEAFDYDAFNALVPVDSVVEITAESLTCASDSDLYPILSISSAGEEYLSYSDAVERLATVRKTGGFTGWLYIIIGVALIVPFALLLINGSAPTSGKVIRTRRSSMPINSKYAKKQ